MTTSLISQMNSSEHTIEGWLRKKGSLFSWRTYFVAVDASRHLSYASKPGAKPSGGVRLDANAKISFDPRKENGLILLTESKAYKFAADSKRDAVLWKEVIEGAIHDSAGETGTGSSHGSGTRRSGGTAAEGPTVVRSSRRRIKVPFRAAHSASSSTSSSRPRFAPVEAHASRTAQGATHQRAVVSAPAHTHAGGGGGGIGGSETTAKTSSGSSSSKQQSEPRGSSTTSSKQQGEASSGAAPASSSTQQQQRRKKSSGSVRTGSGSSQNNTSQRRSHQGESSSTQQQTFADFFFDADKYRLHKAIGKGSYGLVVSGTDLRNSTPCAIKKIGDAFADLVDAKRIVREIRLMHSLSHENLLCIYDCYARLRDNSGSFDDIYIVTELLQTDLHDVIYARRPLSRAHVQYFAYQMLCGLAYMHAKTVVHRDIKPGNILLNDQCQLKICDFGLARALPPLVTPKAAAVNDGASVRHQRSGSSSTRQSSSSSQVSSSSNNHRHTSNGTSSSSSVGATTTKLSSTNAQQPSQQVSSQLTEYVVTRWYRAPELLLSVKAPYDGAVDVWSVGCVVAEMVNRHPLFAGRDVIDQIKRVVSTVKAVRPRDLERLNFVTNNKARAYVQTIEPSERYATWAQVVPKLADASSASSSSSNSNSPRAHHHHEQQRGGGSASPHPGVDFVASLLRFDPANRPSAARAVAHAFLAPMRAELAASGAEDFDPARVDLADVEACPLDKPSLRKLLKDRDLRYTPPHQRPAQPVGGQDEASSSAARVSTSSSRGSRSAGDDSATASTTTTSNRSKATTAGARGGSTTPDDDSRSAATDNTESPGDECGDVERKEDLR